jgi:hypothetical protein
MATTRFAPGQKIAGSPRPKGRGMCKGVNFAICCHAKDSGHGTSELMSGKTENAKDTLCRNVLIYGHCRYEDQGCAFNHEPNNIPGSQTEL